MIFEKRLKMVVVSCETLASLCVTQDLRLRIQSDIPLNAKFKGCHHDIIKDEIIFKFEHESFELVNEGQPIPDAFISVKEIK